MPTSTSPEFTGIKVSVDAAPGGVPANAPSVVGHLDSLAGVIDKSRNVKKYDAINDTEFSQIISMGPLTHGAFTMGVLYDPEATEGINKIEDGIDNNTEVQIIVELNNSLGVNGTKYTRLVKVASFKVAGEKEGKLIAEVSCEVVGTPTVTAASAV